MKNHLFGYIPKFIENIARESLNIYKSLGFTDIQVSLLNISIHFCILELCLQIFYLH